MSEQATEPGMVEGGHLQTSMKGQRMITVSFGGVIEIALIVGGWHFRPHRRRIMGDTASRRLASLIPVSPYSLGVWQS